MTQHGRDARRLDEQPRHAPLKKKDQNKEKASPYRTTEEAAIILRVNKRTMDNWRWAKVGPKYRKHGGTVVYHIDDLKAYSNRTIPATYGE